jgi:hypothetical protein
MVTSPDESLVTWLEKYHLPAVIHCAIHPVHLATELQRLLPF